MSELLTTLARVKGVLEIESDTSDEHLSQLIRNASAVVINACNLVGFGKTLNTEVYDGFGKPYIVLRQPNVIDVVSVSSLGQPVSRATGNGVTVPYSSGFAVDRHRLVLYGAVFPNARSSVSVSYHTGFVRTETLSVPASEPYTVPVGEMWLRDEGTVVSGGFTVDAGQYTFTSGVAGQDVQVVYSYVPADVCEVATALVAERYRWQDRIGVNSKALGGQETVSFSANDIPPYAKSLLKTFKRVTP